MGPLDLLIIFVAIGVVAFLTYQRMARALFSLAVLWAATMLSGVLYEEAAYRFKAVTGANPSLAEGAFFMGLFILFFVLGYVMICVSFPVTKLPKLGFLDYVMGFLLGLVVAVVIVALLHNAIGVMVSERWPDYNAWVQMRNDFYASPLVPFSRAVLSIYGWLFTPFLGPLPPALNPL
ncbi:MAG: CvpA family protein [Anaerolineae bacterium]|nr:CvpA family protein [Anaerolineae bacterium]